jgi:hypothetical protein
VWGVAFQGDFFEGVAFLVFACAAPDGALDVVFGHIFTARFFNGQPQAEVGSGSPPPSRAAKTISRVRRVKIAPRLASAAPFLRLMVDHFECPDMLAAPVMFTHAKSVMILKSACNYTISASGEEPRAERFGPGVDNDGGRQEVDGDVGDAGAGGQFSAQGFGLVGGIHVQHTQARVGAGFDLFADGFDQAGHGAFFGAFLVKGFHLSFADL